MVNDPFDKLIHRWNCRIEEFRGRAPVGVREDSDVMIFILSELCDILNGLGIPDPNVGAGMRTTSTFDPNKVYEITYDYHCTSAEDHRLSVADMWEHVKSQVPYPFWTLGRMTASLSGLDNPGILTISWGYDPPMEG